MEELSNTQLAKLQEQLEATIENIRLGEVISKTQVVTPDRFDPLLRQGLRLP